jgi:hypothetical protein
MQVDPVSEWQRLTEHYRRMSDEELRELAADFSDLTESAQHVLRVEMRSRGLGDPQAATNAPKISVFSPSSTLSDSSNAATANAENTVSRENIRRLPVCQCDDWQQAWQICEALRAEGVESWIQDSRPDIEDSLLYSPQMGPPPALFSPSAFRVLVAADQLPEAREIAEQPIPQEIVDASAREVPEFTPPQCPKCRAEDPVLVSVDPVNSWQCEQCGNEWSELTANSDA